MSIQLSDVTPFLPLAASVLPTLIQAFETAIAQAKGGDPDAALGTLNTAIDQVGPAIASLHADVMAGRAASDAAEDAKFPPGQEPLPAPAKPSLPVEQLRAIGAQLVARFSAPFPPGVAMLGDTPMKP